MRWAALELFWFIFAFIIIRMPSVASRSYELSSGDRPPFTLALIESVAAPSQGLINSILFLLHSPVRAELHFMLKKKKTDVEMNEEAKKMKLLRTKSKLNEDAAFEVILDKAFDMQYPERRTVILSGDLNRGGREDSHSNSKSNRNYDDEIEEALGLKEAPLTLPSPPLSSPDLAQQITLFVGSWNVGNAAPEPASVLRKWIFPTEETYDVYVIGAQECKYKERKGYRNCEHDWFSTIAETLQEAGITHLKKIASVSLWEMRVVVLVTETLLPHVSKVKSSKVRTGVGRVGGNKGGIGISFNILDTSFGFIGSHLAAHIEKVQSRNADAASIIQGIHIGDRKREPTCQFAHLFWFGDLNYRIQKEREEVMELIIEGSDAGRKELLSADQLLTEMKKGVFFGFHEAEIKFDPTYRFERGSRVYSEEKQRVPSWCDRILWISDPSLEATPLQYEAQHEVMTSDHSPIFAVFKVELRDPLNHLASKKLARKPGKFSLVLSHLSARDLQRSADSSSEVRPYVSFKASFLTKRGTTSKKDSLSPVWLDEAVTLVCNAAVMETVNLRTWSLLVEIRDAKVFGVGNDMMASGVLSLRKFDEFTEENCETKFGFDIPLTKAGSQCGSLRGQIELKETDLS